MITQRSSGRRGFSLIELLIVVVIIGILAGVAIPNLKSAIYKADAVKVLADMTTIRLAVFQYMEDNHELPGQVGRGNAPPSLAPYIGDMAFTYKDLIYDIDMSRRRNVVEFEVYFPRGSPVGAELARYRTGGNEAGSVIWSSKKIMWILVKG